MTETETKRHRRREKTDQVRICGPERYLIFTGSCVMQEDWVPYEV